MPAYDVEVHTVCVTLHYYATVGAERRLIEVQALVRRVVSVDTPIESVIEVNAKVENVITLD